MIKNGKDLPMGQSVMGLPDVSPAIQSLFQPVQVGIIQATQINGRTQTIVKQYISTKGVRIATENQLVISRTGERFWAHEDIYFMSDVVLKPDDLFLFNNRQYRVIVIGDWTEYGYNKYTVIQDFTRIYEVKPVKL